MAVNNVYILKGRFKALTTNTFGLFVVFIDKAQKKLEKMSVAASHFSSLYETNPELDWYKFDQNIQQVKYRGEVSQNLTADFQSLFNNSFGPDVIQGFLDGVEGKNLSKAEHVFSSLIEKILQDKSITVQIEKQVLTRDEMDRVKAENENAASAEAKAGEASEPVPAAPAASASAALFSVEEGGVILNVEVVIGPIGGIPVYEVKPLDQIYVKIPGRTQKEMSFINLLNARNEAGEILPVPATVKEVRKDKGSKQVDLLMEIVPGVYGKTMEQESVKLKRYDPRTDARIRAKAASAGLSPAVFGGSVPSPASYSGRSSPSLYLWLIMAVLFVLGFILIFFVFLK